MEKEIIETVLTEILEEQKQANILAENIKNLLENQVAALTKMEQKFLRQNEESRQVILDKIGYVSAQIMGQSKPVKREFRILLFPEQNATNYYKIVFGRIFFWLVILCIAKFAFLLGDKWLNTLGEELRYKRAWESYYRHQGKSGQKAMQKVINQ